MPSETERFLRALYHEARQDDEPPERVAQRIYANARGVSRRELLEGGGALGLGALLGGGGALAATGTAAADASTSDSDGNVGTPGDRVDVFGDGGDFTSLSTDSGTVDGDELVGFPSTSSAVSISFGSWEVLDSNRPVLFSVDVEAETDGTTNSTVFVRVDESGGTTADYDTPVALAQSALPAGVSIRESSIVYLPAGASVKILNSNDPNGNNKINTARKVQL
jgi:hypothetical protein